MTLNQSALLEFSDTAHTVAAVGWFDGEMTGSTMVLRVPGPERQ